MSKERKFHQLIEKLDREEKDQVWDKIKERENLRVMEEGKTIFLAQNYCRMCYVYFSGCGYCRACSFLA